MARIWRTTSHPRESLIEPEGDGQLLTVPPSTEAQAQSPSLPRTSARAKSATDTAAIKANAACIPALASRPAQTAVPMEPAILRMEVRSAVAWGIWTDPSWLLPHVVNGMVSIPADRQRKTCNAAMRGSDRQAPATHIPMLDATSRQAPGHRACKRRGNRAGQDNAGTRKRAVAEACLQVQRQDKSRTHRREVKEHAPKDAERKRPAVKRADIQKRFLERELPFCKRNSADGAYDQPKVTPPNASTLSKNEGKSKDF